MESFKDKMKFGIFNNESYYGYGSKELKSGVCKYYRREMFDKFEWCVMEMMSFGIDEKGKSLVSNIINRLKILIMEELVVDEFEVISKCVLLFEKIDKSDVFIEKVSLIKKICDLVKECRKGRIVSYINNWWRFNKLEESEYDGVVLKKVLKYKKKGDSDRLLVLGEKMIEFIENKEEKIFDVFNKMYDLEDKEGSRYRRKDGIYLYIEILESVFCKDENRKRIFNFVLDRFNKKEMKERVSFGIWFGLMVINKNIDMNIEYKYEKESEEEVMKYLIKEREYIEVNEDFVVNDWHVDKKFGLGKFGRVGSYVVNEDLSLLGENGEKYKNFYILKKEEMDEKKGEEKKNKEKKKNDKEKKEGGEKKEKKKRKELNIKLFDFVDFDENFRVIKVIDEGVCGMKKCCIIVEGVKDNKKYILKEYGKSMNYGIDYLIVDSLKGLFDLKDMSMKIIKSNKYLDIVDKNIRSYVGNWVFNDDKEVYYCLMDFYDNIGDLGKNKDVLKNEKILEEMLKIRLFDGLFRSSDNILRNILVLKDGNGLLSIDEGDLFGKRGKVFNINDWCRKSDWCKKNCGKLIDKWLYGDNKDEKKNIIIEKLKEFGFENNVEEFENRYDNYIDIVCSEFN